jgi:hypothetical protein
MDFSNIGQKEPVFESSSLSGLRVTTVQLAGTYQYQQIVGVVAWVSRSNLFDAVQILIMYPFQHLT